MLCCTRGGDRPALRRLAAALPTLIVVAAVAACVLAVPSASANGPASDPMSSPSCYLASGCSGMGTVPSVGSGQTVPPNSGFGGVALAIPALGAGLGEIPLEPLVWGLGSVGIGVGAAWVGWEIGSTVYHTWLKGLLTDTGSFSVCGTWRWQEVNGDPFGIGHSNYSYLHAMCGPNNSDTFAASPHSSAVTDMAGYEFWHDVINYSGLTHGVLYTVSSTYCNGSSPCYVRADALSDILPFTGPYTTEPPGMSLTVTSGWADPSTGKGVTSQAWPYGSGPSTPTAECKQADYLLPCSSVSPNAGPVQPAYGWPSGWPTNSDGTLADGFASPDINDIRCVVSASFACPQPGTDGTNEFDSTGAPLISMPNCYGITAGQCEGEIDTALSDAGSSVTAAFSTVVAPTYDPEIAAGLVQATIFAAGTLSDATSTTLEMNEPVPDGNCESETAYPHASTTQQSKGLVDAKGRVKCTTDQTVTFTVKLWKCSSEPIVSDAGAPAAVIDELNGGAWGCNTSWTSNPYTVDVVANQWSNQEPAFADEGPDPTAYYIAATYGTGLDPSISQMRPGGSMVVQP